MQVKKRRKGAAGDRPMVSIVVTVKNEASNIRDLLDSLILQEPPLEVLVIDADSTDGTRDIVRVYTGRYPFIRLHNYPAQRGESRNKGIDLAKGEIVAFTDGDCIANPFWLLEIRKSLKENDIVGGNTIPMGYEAFRTLGRVELYHKGLDISFPSCNLAYRKPILKEIDGFDTRFVTAEDMDMNYRAVDRGYDLVENGDMIVYHKERSTFVGFFNQAFWNGFGRKQLTIKHRSLWSKYNPQEMMRKQINFWWLVRTTVALMGYFSYFMAHPKYKIR